METSKGKKDKQREVEYKVFNDPIHGSMKLHPLLVKIIDTPQFQRLRNLKQLGATYWVYPGATHNRFEHSIGVCYLAGQLVEALRSQEKEAKKAEEMRSKDEEAKQDEEKRSQDKEAKKDDKKCNITEEDVLCVQIAGLCHDLGHGPFSHMFDNMFIPRARPGHEWTHEDASVMMFDHLVQENNLRDIMVEYGLNLNEDLVFIKELINGPQNQEEAQGNEWPYQGRRENKSFLYEIVANKRNGIDVDKWDYFARDCHHLGIQNNFDYRRFIAFARVCEDENGEKQICIRNKEVRNVYDMFHTRRSLYLKACNHRVCNIIENMITEAFLAADEHIKFQGKDGKMVKLSETINDMVAYTKVTDHVFHQILTSDDSNLSKPREILERITKRDFYKFVGETQPHEHMPHTQKQCRTLEAEIAQTVLKGEGNSLEPEDLVVDVVTVDHRIKKKNPWEKTNPSIDSNDGANKGNPNPDAQQVVTIDKPEEKKVNPLDKVRVYSKYDPNRGIPIPEAQRHRQLPDSLAEQLIRVYCKKKDKPSMEAARSKFEQWCIVHAHTKWMEISMPSKEEASGTAGGDEQSQEQPGEQSAETGSDKTGTSDQDKA